MHHLEVFVYSKNTLFKWQDKCNLFFRCPEMRKITVFLRGGKIHVHHSFENGYFSSFELAVEDLVGCFGA